MSDDLNTVLETIRANRYDSSSEKNCPLAAICGLDVEGALIAESYNLEGPSALSDRAKAVLYWKTGRGTDAALYDEWSRAFCDNDNWCRSFRARATNADYLTLLEILTSILEDDDFYSENIEVLSHHLPPFEVNGNSRAAVLAVREGKLRLFDRHAYEDPLGSYGYTRMLLAVRSELDLMYIVDTLSTLIERGFIVPQWFAQV